MRKKKLPLAGLKFKAIISWLIIEFFLFRYGIYPLTAFTAKLPPPVRPRAISPEVTESVKSVTPEPVDFETRRVVNMICNVKPREDSCELLVSFNRSNKITLLGTF